MSQFAELFKAVKNEPKTLPDNRENKKLTSDKNLKQVKARDEKNGENKFRDALSSEAKNLKKHKQISEKGVAPASEVGRPLQTQVQLQEQTKVAGNPRKIGKRSNDEYTQVLTYIRRDTHRQMKKVLIDDPDERDLSDLVEELLSAWLEKNV